MKKPPSPSKLYLYKLKCFNFTWILKTIFFPTGVCFVSKGNFKFTIKTRYKIVITETLPVEYSHSTQTKA